MADLIPSGRDYLGEVNIELRKATYRFAMSGLAAPSGVAVTLYGSATKTVRITRIGVSITAATAALISATINKYSTAPTSGTKTNPAMVPLDSTDAAASATNNNAYTVAPTAGTLVGAADSVRGLAPSATVAGMIEWEFEFGQGAKNLVLNGAAEGIGISLSAAGTLDFSIEWTEE